MKSFGNGIDPVAIITVVRAGISTGRITKRDLLISRDGCDRASTDRTHRSSLTGMESGCLGILKRRKNLARETELDGCNRYSSAYYLWTRERRIDSDRLAIPGIVIIARHFNRSLFESTRHLSLFFHGARSSEVPEHVRSIFRDTYYSCLGRLATTLYEEENEARHVKSTWQKNVTGQTARNRFKKWSSAQIKSGRVSEAGIIIECSWISRHEATSHTLFIIEPTTYLIKNYWLQYHVSV